jgi:CBS domain containing-hemolysin-like protein
VDIQGWRFEVVDLDGRRIDKLLVSRIAAMRRARLSWYKGRPGARP